MQADIVVIDSEPTVRRVMIAILMREGCTVRGTGDLGEAIRLLRERRPDLVLTNVMLLGVSAHDAMLRLKAEFPSLPVLMVSGLPDQDVISEWRQKDGFDVFPKPFRAADLIAKVQQMLAPPILGLPMRHSKDTRTEKKRPSGLPGPHMAEYG